MNKGLLWLNVFLVLAVGVLFFLYFTRTNNGNGSVHGVKSMNTDSGSGAQVRIGYFDMDSIEANFSLFKEMQTAIGKMEDSMNNVINAMKNNFQRRYEKFQTDRFHFTQEQLDSAGMEPI